MGNCREAIVQKHPNIFTVIKSFVEDDSVSDCIERFLIKIWDSGRLPARN